MSAVDAVETHGGMEVRLRRLAAAEDRRHLLVILSGFRPANAPYDFAQSSASHVGCDVLWIQDHFDGGPTYYLRAKGRPDPEIATQAAIRAELERLDLGTDRLTIAGFSKGGTAAIYHGLKLNAANVLATVPQFFVGSYVRDYWPNVLTHMSTPGQDDSAELDRILPDHLGSRAESRTNMYILSSEADPSHFDEIVPNLDWLQALDQFTLIMSSWPRITGHIDVTPQNRALVVALLVQLTQGLAPRFAETHIGELPASQRVLDAQWDHRETVSVINKLQSRGNRLHVEGAAFLRGRPIANYGDIARSLVLSGTSTRSMFELGTVLDENLTARFHRGSKCNYTAGAFATIGYGGISLIDVPQGTYKLAVEVKEHGVMAEAPLRSDRALMAIVLDGARGVRAKISQRSATVDVFSLFGQVPENHDLRIEAFNVVQDRLDVRGWFAVPGMPARNWGDVEYYLVLQGPNEAILSHRLGLLHRPRTDLLCGDPADFAKAYFSPLGDAGIDVSSLDPGEYQVHLTISNTKAQRTAEIGNLTVDCVNDSQTGQVRVAVVGSCVTRDNFTSSIAPEWRHCVTLVGEHYQSSILSIFGDEVPMFEGEFADLESHALTELRREFGREFLRGLGDSRPDVVIVDLFSDARFGVIDAQEGPITDSSWKLAASSDAVRFRDCPRASMDHERQSYLSRVETAARRLAVEVQQRAPGATLILHAARAVSRWRDEVGERNFPAASIAELNERWAALDAAFLRGAPQAVVIDELAKGLVSDSRHPRGKHYVHYEATYYRRFAERLHSLLGSHREYRIHLAPNIGRENSLSRETA